MRVTNQTSELYPNYVPFQFDEPNQVEPLSSNNDHSEKVVEQKAAISVPSTQSKENLGTESQWRKHKVKILTAAAFTIFSIAAAILYNSQNCWTSNPSDAFNCYTCLSGKWQSTSLCMPVDKLCQRVTKCKNGIQMPGCNEQREYFHYLSKECIKNPLGWGCKQSNTPSECDKILYPNGWIG